MKAFITQVDNEIVLRFDTGASYSIALSPAQAQRIGERLVEISKEVLSESEVHVSERTANHLQAA